MLSLLNKYTPLKKTKNLPTEKMLAAGPDWLAQLLLETNGATRRVADIHWVKT